jgi:4-hydroxy-tetrahydrodipicolinate reductase
MIKAAVTGAGGRMGGRIITLIQKHEELTLAGALEKPGHPLLGQDAGKLLGLDETGVKIVDDPAAALSRADLIIDFSLPEGTLEVAGEAARQKKPAVIGTTGLNPEQRKTLAETVAGIPVVFAPNMSVGVNVMFKIIGEVAGILGSDYDIEVIEAHHRFKQDAPSGTAVRMGEILAEARGGTLKELGRFHREGFIGERSGSEIGMQTIRAGDIVGEHTVIFGGIGERIEVTHRAHNRDNFANGALRAALWVVLQPPGLYDMMDVLGLK